MSNPLLHRHKSKVALDALLEDIADPRHGNGDGDFHVDPDYNNPMGQKGTEPENVHYGAPEGGHDIHCRECGAPISEYEQMMQKGCLAGTDYHSIGGEEMGLLLDDWMNSGTLAKQGGAMCTCGCPMAGHTKPPDFGCPNEPGCGCKGATEAKTGAIGDKTEDPRIQQWMMDFVEENPVNETFPQYMKRRSQEPKAMAQHASKEAEAPLPVQNHDEVDPLLYPADKIFKRSLEAVLAAAGGKAFMYGNFHTAEDASNHLFETMRVASAPKTDFRTIWAWATQYFPSKKAANNSPIGTKQSGFTGGGPFSCHDCIHRKDSSCTHPMVLSDPEVKKEADGSVKVDRDDCCNFVRPASIKKDEGEEEKTSAVEQKMAPKILPPSNMRSHLDEDVKDDINNMVKKPVMEGAKGVHIGAETRYPDSGVGAIQCLTELSDGLDLTNATVKPDPSVRGVWQVSMTNGQKAIVYLAGYPDPMGKVRPNNDFEVSDEQPTTAAMTDDTGAVTGLRNRPDYGESDSYTSEANREAKTGDLGTAMRVDEDDAAEYFNDQVQDAKREAKQSFLEDEFYQQEAQDNGWTMDELWAQIGEEYTNEYWQSRNASAKKASKLATCPNCKSSKVLPVQNLKIKSASGRPLQECQKCGSFFTF